MFLIFRNFQEAPDLPLILTPEEFRHVRARRLNPGDLVHIGNGHGLRLVGPLSADGKSVSELRQDERWEQPARPLYLCTAVPGGKRWDWLLEKATELGVTHVIPIQYQRSDRMRFSRERGARIFEQAAAQSQGFHLPELLPETVLWELHQHLPSQARPMVLRPEATVALRDAWTEPQGAREVGSEGDAGVPTFIIGPEGGFAEQELEYFRERGWSSYKLGRMVLRIETAGVAALAMALAHT